MSTVNVLLTGAGTQTFANVFHALRSQREIDLTIIAGDIDPLAYGLYLADKKYILPGADDPHFTPKILKICREEKIRIIIPLLSLEFMIFSRDREIFKSAGISVPISDFVTVDTCNDKKKTYDFFNRFQIPTPPTYTPENLPSSLEFPLAVKPRISSGSKHFHKVNSIPELMEKIRQVDRPVIQEFISGEEMTVDILADNRSDPLAVIPRKRCEVINGKSVIGQTYHDDKMIKTVTRIIKLLKIKGPGNIQCFKSGNKYLYTEINPRFSAGGLSLTVRAGANTPLMLVKMALGREVMPVREFKDNIIMMRYYTDVFIDKKLL